MHTMAKLLIANLLFFHGTPNLNCKTCERPTPAAQKCALNQQCLAHISNIFRVEFKRGCKPNIPRRLFLIFFSVVMDNVATNCCYLVKSQICNSLFSFFGVEPLDFVPCYEFRIRGYPIDFSAETVEVFQSNEQKSFFLV